MGGGGGGGNSRELDQTPTWAVASVCGVIVLISILLEMGLHKVGEVRQTMTTASIHVALPCNLLLFALLTCMQMHGVRSLFQFFAHRKKKAMVEALEKVKAGEEEDRRH